MTFIGIRMNYFLENLSFSGLLALFRVKSADLFLQIKIDLPKRDRTRIRPERHCKCFQELPDTFQQNRLWLERYSAEI